MPRDPYDVLEVECCASEEEIAIAFRRLAKQYHAERNPDDPQAAARYDEVLAAYGILGDNTRREQYDRLGYAGLQGSYQWGNRIHNFQGAERDAIDNLLKLFGEGGSHADSGRQSGRTKAYTVDVCIPLATAARGGSLALRFGDMEVDVKAPVGVKDGQMLRLGGVGPHGEDVFIKLHIPAHPQFQREGKELVLEVPLSLPEAVLGASVSATTPDGAKLSITVPPGASSMERLRFAGKGIDGGDLMVQLKILAPVAKEERSRAIIAEYGCLNPRQARVAVGALTPDARLWDQSWLPESNPPVLRLPLSLTEAVLGTEVAVPLADGATTSVRVMPGASSGERQPLRQAHKRGVWTVLRQLLGCKGTRQGELFLQLEIVTQAPQDDRGRALIEEFGYLNPQSPRDKSSWN